MNIGVLGGTFDPIHGGHLAAAAEATSRLELAEVIFVPAGRPWLKPGEDISPAAQRLEMVCLAIADKPGYKLSSIEIERPGPTYTVDTMAELRQKYTTGDKLYFIIGRDKLAELPQWHQPQHLIALCRLVAVPRVGCPEPDLDELEKALPGISQRLVMLDGPRIDVSSSMIRDRVRRGLDISRLVPEAVVGYIREKGLYKA